VVVGGAAALLTLVVATPSLRELFHFGVLHADDVVVVIVGSVLALLWLDTLRLVQRLLGPKEPLTPSSPA
jgi:hypothetical protein